MENRQLSLARRLVEQTSVNLFLTGKAGTGKTTFLRELRERSPKRMIVVAPTGVAAINAGGVTIHSFFQLAFAPYVPESERGLSADRRQDTSHFNRQKINIIKSIDLLVIDEISMVRADVLDAVSDTLRRYRDRSKPFGGVQLLMIGDVRQLAPVVRDEEWALLGQFYASPFFFESKALRQTPYASIELEHIYRQSDDRFIELLNRIRDSDPDAATLAELNRRYRPDFRPADSDGYITLTSHNHAAQSINSARLDALPGDESRYRAVIGGEFPEYLYPTDADLVLKEGAQVMFVKNDPSPQKRYYNGRIGIVTRLDGERIDVLPQGETEPIAVEPGEWTNAKYIIDPETKEISEQIDGTFTQYPLKTAWAITIHKSQGLTFERAVIDAAGSFSHGQVYVALSRCRSLDGVVLSSPLSSRSIVSDTTVRTFCDRVTATQPGEAELDRMGRAYYLELLNELFGFSPLEREMRRLRQVVREHFDRLYPKLVARWQDDTARFATGIADVAGRFRGQIARLASESADPRTDPALDERVRKGVGYFAAQCRELITPLLGESGVEADSKEVRKALADALSRCSEALAVKTATLEAASDGFSVAKHLEARAKAALEKPVAAKGREGKVSAPADILHPALFERLRDWRRAEAAGQEVPAYVVMSQQALSGVANLLPSSIAELKRIKGIGDKFIERYAGEVLGIVSDFRTESGTDMDFDALSRTAAPDEGPATKPVKPVREKKPRTDTRRQTLDLLREGLTPDQIARTRGLTPVSIEGHIADLIRSGELDAAQFVPRDRFDAIALHLGLHPGEKLALVRESLGSDFSYRDIRFVQSELERDRA